jgi:hypothetical protein
LSHLKSYRTVPTIEPEKRGNAMKLPILPGLFTSLLTATLLMLPFLAMAEKMVSFDKVTGQGVYEWDSGIHYEGAFGNGQPQGQGVMTWLSGQRYEGQFYNGQFNGQGVMTFAAGSRYEGGWQNNKYSGRGILTWPSGKRYDGDFIAGQYYGQGVMTYADGGRYEGGWQNDKYSGEGIRTLASGQRYQGGYLDGKHSGRGILTTPSGQRYDGDFVDGKYYGQGVMTYKDGSRYEGGWQNGKHSGEGIKTFAGGQRYQGGFLDGKYSGRGILTWPGGQRYDGEFMAGLYHGYGEMKYAGGDRYAGNWANDKRAGKTIKEEQELQSRSSDNSGQWVAGLIGLAAIGSAKGISDVEKVKFSAGFLSDVATDGKGQGIQAAARDVQTTRNQSEAVQQAIAEQRRRTEEVQRARLQAEQDRKQAQLTLASSQKSNTQRAVNMNRVTEPVKPPSAVITKVNNGANISVVPDVFALDYDALVGQLPQTERFSYTCGRYNGEEMMAVKSPDNCNAEMKRYMVVQCFPGAAMNEANILRLKCAVEKSRGGPKTTYSNHLEGAKALIRRYSIKECNPEIGCIGTLNLGNN